MSNDIKKRVMHIYGRVIAEADFFPNGWFAIVFKDGDKKTFTSINELDEYMERKINGL